MEEKDKFLGQLEKSLRELDRLVIQPIILDMVEDLPGRYMFVLIDQEGLFLYPSERWCSLFGYRYSELKGKPFMAFVHPEDYQRTLDAWQDKPDILEPFENRYRHKAGHFIQIAWQPTRSKARAITAAYAWPVES